MIMACTKTKVKGREARQEEGILGRDACLEMELVSAMDWTSAM